uniref:Myb-like domain-containing protein n=1 Tax=Lactuca sativa TaxID=4236 RepID=A0A9R1VNU8_LACSA|nr:hypothetical protein LSAT_V11C400164720 [Lactuca sativa]
MFVYKVFRYIYHEGFRGLGGHDVHTSSDHSGSSCSWLVIVLQQPSQPPHSPDFVSETQHLPPPQPKKKEKKTSPTHHHPRKEEKLDEAWISASQDPIEGDSQTFGCFWEKVYTVFYELTGSESRNPDQISSKWRDIRLKCTEFGGIYNNLRNI